MVRTEVVKLCQENNFNTGFFEGSDNSVAVDAYELKVIGILCSVQMMKSNGFNPCPDPS